MNSHSSPAPRELYSSDIILIFSVVTWCTSRSSSSWRRAYIVAYRTVACIAEERKVGFDHSHNSEVNWDDWDLSGNPHVAAARESRE